MRERGSRFSQLRQIGIRTLEVDEELPIVSLRCRRVAERRRRAREPENR
jgi:hypothetical protein